ITLMHSLLSVYSFRVYILLLLILLYSYFLSAPSTPNQIPFLLTHILGLFLIHVLFLICIQAHPDTEVHTISLYNGLKSLMPLWVQVQNFRKAIEEIMNQSPEGVHLLCFSQGGVICRAVLSTSPNHNVHTFIALSSPLAGHSSRLHTNINYLKDNKYNFTWSATMEWGQKFQFIMVSLCADPHHRADYLRGNTFLPLINGEKPHKLMKDWRENFLRIKKMVLIGGPDDGVITPWQSSHYGFYDASEDVVEMRNQEFYKRDTFGLRTLDARGDVSMCVQSGVEHTKWHSNITVFNNCIKKWLI
uniref:palmitoyl-CoA hydrolase n=1 Tax=Fundulus heteroclitus TaxID=8078 RepID=A0A3Q2PAV0_FUNHE